MKENIITKIENQKRNPNRKSIFINGSFAFGLDLESFCKLNLKTGDRLSPEKIKEITWLNDKQKAKDVALRFLSYRVRSEKEVKDKLKTKGFEEKIINQTIDNLKRLDLIDDERFACLWVEDRLRNKPRGERLLKQELQKKGITKEIIDKTLEHYLTEDTETKLASELATKRQKRYKNLDKKVAQRRLADFLLRRGFSYQVVRDVLSKIIEV